MESRETGIPKLDWLDPLKAFALLAILWNHFAEEFGSGPWFTNPSNGWPDFATRIRNVFPHDHGSSVVSLLQFLGWLGDSGPGVFILVSGLGLAWAAHHRQPEETCPVSFYKRRLVRLFPLYIAMHFVILAVSLFSPRSQLTLANPKTLLSLLGLRFTDSLFFYISPAWWFVWLIIQLYLVFPFLWRLLGRVGIKWFLLITLGFTFLSRLYGILYSDSLYFWMTGIFFGTRLAEFSVGMVLAVCLARGSEKKRAVPDPGSILGASLAIYLLGLACSLTWVGSVVSNLLVSVGLSGLFFSLWRGFLGKSRGLSGLVSWIGVNSYGVYLLHQPLLKWTGTFKSFPWHFAAALVILFVSFPLAWFVDRSVTTILEKTRRLGSWERYESASLLLSVVALALLFPVELRLASSAMSRALALLVGLILVFLGFIEHASSEREERLLKSIRWATIFAVFLRLFLLPAHHAILSVAFGAFMALLGLIIYRRVHLRWAAWATSAAVSAIIVAILELLLAAYAPIEAGRWGELPALQAHPTRVYGLKPNQLTRLKYNNYDYVVRTNSLGLASPEISLERPSPDTLRILVIGDAFSMPEGLEYERSYPALLEKKLAEKLNPRLLQVINAGVTGYGPVEEHAQLKELVPLLKPDIVVYEFFINEFSEVNLAPGERLQEIGLGKSNNSSYNAAMSRSQFFAHLGRAKTSLRERITGRPGGWRYSKSLLDYYRTGENELYSEQTLAKVKTYLVSMGSMCRDAGSELVLYFVPGAVAVSKPSDIAYFPWGQDLSDKRLYDLQRPMKTLKAIADETGIPLIDLTPGLKDHPKQPVYFPESWHWNTEGHEAVAQTIADTLTAMGYLGRTTR